MKIWQSKSIVYHPKNTCQVLLVKKSEDLLKLVLDMEIEDHQKTLVIYYKINKIKIIALAFPGPGAYNLPSVFDKTKRNKPALN